MANCPVRYFANYGTSSGQGTTRPPREPSLSAHWPDAPVRGAGREWTTNAALATEGNSIDDDSAARAGTVKPSSPHRSAATGSTVPATSASRSTATGQPDDDPGLIRFQTSITGLDRNSSRGEYTRRPGRTWSA